MTSYFKTFSLMALLTVLTVGIAGMFGGRSWAIGAFGFAALLNFGSLCIVNPLTGRAAAFAGLLRTRPPTEGRVRRLEELARRGV